MSVMSEPAEVEVATEQEMRDGVALALGRIGFTYEELAAQAHDNRFASEEARLVWFAISPPDGAVC